MNETFFSFNILFFRISQLTALSVKTVSRPKFGLNPPTEQMHERLSSLHTPTAYLPPTYPTSHLTDQPKPTSFPAFRTFQKAVHRSARFFCIVLATLSPIRARIPQLQTAPPT